MALPSQWFLRKRGLATGPSVSSTAVSRALSDHSLLSGLPGIAVSGSGFFGAINTLLVRLTIVRLGSRHTLLVFTFILSAFWIGAYFLLEERTPPPRKADLQRDGHGKMVLKSRPWLPKGCWRNPVFYSFMASIFFSTFGFLVRHARLTFTSLDLFSRSN